MVDTTLPYGKKRMPVKLPDGPIIHQIEPVYLPGMDRPQDALRQALQSPAGAPPLRELARSMDRVGIIFNDVTRATPSNLLVHAILDEIPHVPASQVTLFNALGTHRANTSEELRAMLGNDLVSKYRVVQNNASDEGTQMYVGTTRRGHPVWLNRELWECDLLILTGFIEPHFFAGFSGGGKAIMPGMAGMATIHANHSAEMLSDPKATWGVTDGNPVWEEVREVARMHPRIFLLNVTLNKDHELTGIFCGDLDEAYQKGESFARQVATTPVEAPFDIVLTSNSGSPLDLNLYQAVKGMSAAAQIVKPGGAIIIAAECRDGLPNHSLYARLLGTYQTPRVAIDSILHSSTVCGDQWQVQIQAQILLKADVYVYSECLSDDQIRAAMLKPCRDIESTLSKLIALYGPAASIGVLSEGPQTIPYLAR